MAQLTPPSTAQVVRYDDENDVPHVQLVVAGRVVLEMSIGEWSRLIANPKHMPRRVQ